jgi:competence protein ComEC
MVAAVAYDIMAGSRIGTERALYMTLIMLSAVLLDRQALTMRNLALAALAVLVFEPEALLGASFQLSFAAVGALVAVYEARMAAEARGGEREATLGRTRRHGLRAAMFATFCATSATASFMAYDFHEVNPYVLVGNPLTLATIEIFAVPGALLGTILYPFGLDAFVWHYVGLGISLILAAARFIGGLPGATIHLPAFAPWSLAFLASAVLSVVIWRTWLMRATAIPLACIGLAGAVSGPSFDVAVAPLGDAVAVRQADGHLVVVGRRPSAFAAEQWLRADGRAISLVYDQSAFAEDCLRAAVVVTPLFAPTGCAADLVIDRESLRKTGAVSLKVGKDGALVMQTARESDEDRPWSPAPIPHWTYDPLSYDVKRDESGDATPSLAPSAPDENAGALPKGIVQ